MPIYLHPTTERPSKHPYGFEDAKRAGSKLYNRLEDPCELCGADLVYTRTRRCYGCAHESARYYQQDRSQETDEATFFKPGFPCENGHVGKFYRETGACFACQSERDKKAARALLRKKAREAGRTWYMPPENEPCALCDVWAKKRVKDNQCFNCVSEARKAAGPKPPGAQDAAKEKGLKWYMPERACSRCGVIAPRRATNRACRQCEINRRAVKPPTLTAEHRMMRDVPNLILTRGHAKVMGLAVYRTGKPCSQGHEGFRYTSSGNCVDCHAERGG